LPPRAATWASLDTPVLRARPWPFALPSRPGAPAPTWVQTATCCGYGNFTPAAVAASSAALFDEPCLPAAWPVVAEWGYELLNNAGDIFPLCGNLTFAGRARAPASRAEAGAWARAYWGCRAAAERARANASAGAPVVSEIGHYLLSGLSGAADAAVVPGSEVGENINSVNLHIAASRGAARQLGAPFLIDFSSWMRGFVADFSPPPGFWGAASSPVGGHSASLTRRAGFAAFMGGAGAHVAEAGAVNYFAASAGGAPFPLSPLGAVGAELFAFSHAAGGAEAARGVPFAPLALVVPADAGYGLGYFYNAMAWDYFPLTDAEARLAALLEGLWPRSLTVERDMGGPASEAHTQVGGAPGDCADLLVAGGALGSDLLGAYRAAFLVGVGAAALEAAAPALRAFAEGGGLLVVDAADVAGSAALPAAWLGVDVRGAAAPARVARVVDAQTNWSAAAPPAHAPFCAPDDAGANWYIKTGGDPAVARGWAPGTDRCCSESEGACVWFTTEAGCAAALPRAACRACPASPAPADVGCPAWAPPGAGGVPAALAPAALAGAGAPLFELTLADGSRALGATRAPAGAGAVVVLLADGAALWGAGGLGLAAHLLARVADDTAPAVAATNVTADAGAGVQVLLNRLPWGWVATVINNNGVVKQPDAAPTVDAGEGRAVALTLAAREGAVASAWAADGGGARAPLAVEAGTTVRFEVEAGGLRVVGLVLA